MRERTARSCYHRSMRRGIGGLLAGLVLCIAAPAGADPSTVDLLSYNVWAVPYGISPNIESRLQAIASEIVRRKPDLVALQELWRSEDAKAVGARLAEAGYAHHHFGPGAAGADDEKGSGLFIASRWPITEVTFKAFVAGRTPHIPWHVDWMAHKGVAAVRVESPAGPLVFADTHLQATYRTGNYDFVQLAQALTLSRALDRIGREAPLFLVGDLNARPGSLPVDVITSQLALAPAQDSYELDHILSRPGRHLGLRLEHAAQVLEEPVTYEGGEGPLSDHPCLIAQYSLIPCDDCPPPQATAAPKLTARIAQRLQRERTDNEHLSVAARVGAVLALGAAALLLRRLGLRRSTMTGSAVLALVALYFAYLGLHFAPARDAQVRKAASALNDGA